MKYLKSVLATVGLVAIVGVSVQAVSSDNYSTTHNNTAPTKDSLTVVHDYNVYAIPLPQHIKFAGERVPLENPDIRKRLDRELLVNTYWQSNGLLLIKRAHQYFPLIEKILKKHGVPDDFKYLAVAESGLQQVVSPAGATGFWQFMKGTARDYGLEVNDNIDERYHIAKETEAACAYLKNAKEKLGSWTLAAASYNAGLRGITRQQERQEVNDYYDLLLGSETSRYVFRIIALKEILSHPKKYGFNFAQKDLYSPIPTREVAVDTSVSNFAQFAKNFGINYKILKIHNPWLREAQLENDEGKMYYISIPKKGIYNYTP